ncbi:MAG: hypothetical protein J7M25_12605 [Deltaproteobacteria bacterium]|nr:hypothetical protein [Deltaproteobacteria bacterium]
MKRLFFLSMPILAMFVLGNCILSKNVDDFDFQLPNKTFEVDVSLLGLSTTTDIQCSGAVDTCSQVNAALVCDKQAGYCTLAQNSTFPNIDCSAQDICQSFGEVVHCDGSVCRAAVPLQLSASVNLAEEVPELKDVANLTFTEVRLKDLYMDIEVNSLGIDLPPMDLYVGPDALATLTLDGDGNVTDMDVSKVGTIPVTPAGFTGRQEVDMSDAGRHSLTKRMKTPAVPFRFFLVAQIALDPGDPLPDLTAGQVQGVVSGHATASLAR